MARIGKKPIPVPDGVSVTINKNAISVKGPKGQLERVFSPDIIVENKDGQVTVSRPTEQRHHRALHGLTRALLNNMVTGVSDGFTKDLEIVGVGYRATMKGKDLELNVGYSHPVLFEGSDDIQYEVGEGGRSIVVKGIDKEIVGEIAARIRRTRPPEPYKGKGIRYKGEHVRRKAGKAGATA
ncbi:MAG: 50S ribosomal protein L6 [Chloroflexota bacterium]